MTPCPVFADVIKYPRKSFFSTNSAISDVSNCSSSIKSTLFPKMTTGISPQYEYISFTQFLMWSKLSTPRSLSSKLYTTIAARLSLKKAGRRKLKSSCPAISQKSSFTLSPLISLSNTEN